MTFVPLNPIPLKDRTSMIFLQYGQIDVLGPGTQVSTAAVCLVAARVSGTAITGR